MFTNIRPQPQNKAIGKKPAPPPKPTRSTAELSETQWNHSRTNLYQQSNENTISGSTDNLSVHKTTNQLRGVQSTNTLSESTDNLRVIELVEKSKVGKPFCGNRYVIIILIIVAVILLVVLTCLIYFLARAATARQAELQQQSGVPVENNQTDFFPSVNCPRFANYVGPDGSSITIQTQLLISIGSSPPSQGGPNIDQKPGDMNSMTRASFIYRDEELIFVQLEGSSTAPAAWLYFSQQTVEIRGYSFNCSVIVRSPDDVYLPVITTTDSSQATLSSTDYSSASFSSFQSRDMASVLDSTTPSPSKTTSQATFNGQSATSLSTLSVIQSLTVKGSLTKALLSSTFTTQKPITTSTSTTTQKPTTTSTSTSTTQKPTTTSTTSTSTSTTQKPTTTSTTSTTSKSTTTSTSTTTSKSTTTSTSTTAQATTAAIVTPAGPNAGIYTVPSPRKVVVIFFNFLDHTVLPISPLNGIIQMFETNSTTNVNDMFYRLSRGKTAHRGINSSRVDYFGWFQIQANYTNNCNYWDWSMKALALANVKRSDYNHVIFVPSRADYCFFGGLAYITSDWMMVRGEYLAGWMNELTGVTAHEMGHNMGLHHSGANRCNDPTRFVDVYGTCVADQYGDPIEVMGSYRSPPFHFYARNLVYLKWIPAQTLANVSRNGTWTLDEIGTPSPTTSSSFLGAYYQLPAPYLVLLGTNNITTTHYYLELHRASLTSDLSQAQCKVILRLSSAMTMPAAFSFTFPRYFDINDIYTDPINRFSFRVLNITGSSCKSTTIQFSTWPK